MRQKAIDPQVGQMPSPPGGLLDRVGSTVVAELLHSCLGSAEVDVALFDLTLGAWRLGGLRLAPLDDDPVWQAVGLEAMVSGRPVDRTDGARLLVAAPVPGAESPLASVSCAAAAADPTLLRALASAAARALTERALRSALDAEHARLLAREKEARADAEAAHRRLAFLDQATAALIGAPLDARQRLETIARLAVPDLADWCWVDLYDSDAGLIERLAVAHWNPAGAELAARQRGLQLPLAGGDLLRRGEPLVLAEIDPAVPLEGHDGALYAALGARSAVVMPLRVPGTVLGSMTFLFAESNRRYAPADLGLASDLAQRAAFAVDNARHFQAAERAVRARDEMLAVVSHDLRNPLSAILANAGVLVRRAPPGEEGEKIRMRGEAIKRSAARMNHLIRDLLDLARIESRRLQLDRDEHDVAGIVAEALEMFQPLASEQQVSLSSEVGEGVRTLSCDRERILQVLSNLVGNAIKFTPAGGSVRLLAIRESDRLRFGVADTGTGIAPENLENIFDRFWQVRASGRAGAGLGLSIARGIVQAHGGRIWAESAPGKGSTFWFTLPA